MPLGFPMIEQRHTLWGRMASCAPVANRSQADLLSEDYRRVTNPPQVANLPHRPGAEASPTILVDRGAGSRNNSVKKCFSAADREGGGGGDGAGGFCVLRVPCCGGFGETG